MIEQLGQLKCLELIKVTTKSNQMMVGHSKPINLSWLLESDWVRFYRSSLILWKLNLSPHHHIYISVRRGLDVATQQVTIPPRVTCSNVLPNFFRSKHRAQLARRSKNEDGKGRIFARYTWIHLPVLWFLTVLTWSDQSIRTVGTWC